MLVSKIVSNDKELALQMACPCGEQGRCLAKEMYGQNKQILAYCFQKFPNNTYSILELGHGNAAHVADIFNLYPKTTYFGLEISETMYAESVRINQLNIQKKRVQFAIYDGESLPFKNTSFEVLFSLNTIYFWTNPVKLLQEAHRVLVAYGVFVISFCTPQSMKRLPYSCFGFKLYEIEEWEVFFESEGFFIAKKNYFTESNNNNKMNREFVCFELKKIIQENDSTSHTY